MAKTKIISLALVGLLMIGAIGINAFAMETDGSSMEKISMQTIEFVADPNSTQEEKLAVLTKIVAEYNPSLHAELVSITAEHDQFHQDATASQQANQASRELEVSAIVQASKTGEITKPEAKTALEQIKAETAEATQALADIKANKTKEDGQLKGLSSSLGTQLVAEFSSGTPDTAVINQLLAELVENQRVHLEIDYKYQAQIDELLGLN